MTTTGLDRRASSEGLVHPLLARLVARRPAFVAFVRARLRSEADAEDLVQQALLKAGAQVDAVRDEARLEAWFHRILRNAIADHYVDLARREARLEALTRDASSALPVEAAVCGCSLGVLQTLPESYAAILRHADIDELSMNEVAAALGISVANTKVRLHRARIALRQALLAFCKTDSVDACRTCTCE
ncbi:MAG: sigma factor [Polyangiaceae bacterium]